MPQSQADPVHALVKEILASDPPAAYLLKALETLAEKSDLISQAAVFEALVWRIGIREYWVWYRMSRVYAELGRHDAMLLCSAETVRLGPDWEASFLPYQEMFRHFVRRGDAASAVDVFLRHHKHHPKAPIAPLEQVATLMRELGLDPEAAVREATSTPGDAVLAGLADLIRTTFRQPHARISESTTAEDVDGWDSFTHSALIGGVERAFGIAFAPGEAAETGDVGTLVALVTRKLAAARPAKKPKLIFYGNCQIGALDIVFRNTPALRDRYEVVVHDVWATGETLARDLRDFDDAAVLVRQDLRNWTQHPLRDALPSGLQQVVVPFCFVGALWPCDSVMFGHDKAMDRAMREVKEAGGTAPFGFTDGALGWLRNTIPDPEERYRRYRNLDFPGAPDPVRYAMHDEARLLADDAKLGCTVGRFIVDNYRRVRLFHAIAHPTPILTARLAADVARRLGLDVAIEQLVLYQDYMGETQVPLHPEVIRGLGIEWADETTRYVYHWREHLTFEEYFRRYIAYPLPADA
jgi:acyl carrier protein